MVFGGLLLFTAAGLSQFSNRGWFAVWVLPVICMIVVIWSALWGASTHSESDPGGQSAAIDRLSPLLVRLLHLFHGNLRPMLGLHIDLLLLCVQLLPLLAIWVAGWALARCGQTAKWSEATTTMLSFSILLIQVIMTVANVNLGIVSTDSEGFFTATTSMLWLTQFIFVPVVLLDRASFPILSLALGAGLLDTKFTLFTVRSLLSLLSQFSI